MLIELLCSWQLSRKKREGGAFTDLAHNSCQSTLHRSQWKFIFPIGHISFRIRLDSMLKLIRNYINLNGLTVHKNTQQHYTTALGYIKIPMFLCFYGAVRNDFEGCNIITAPLKIITNRAIKTTGTLIVIIFLFL